MTFGLLHQDNKIEYTDQQQVQVTLDGNIDNVVTGRIVGKASSGIIDIWIVLLDKPIEGFPFSAFTTSHTLIRPLGDNRPFLCEGVSRV